MNRPTCPTCGKLLADCWCLPLPRATVCIEAIGRRGTRRLILSALRNENITVHRAVELYSEVTGRPQDSIRQLLRRFCAAYGRKWSPKVSRQAFADYESDRCSFDDSLLLLQTIYPDLTDEYLQRQLGRFVPAAALPSLTIPGLLAIDDDDLDQAA